MTNLPTIPDDSPETRETESVVECEPPLNDLSNLSAEEKARDHFAHLLLTAWSMVLEEDGGSCQAEVAAPAEGWSTDGDRT